MAHAGTISLGSAGQTLGHGLTDPHANFNLHFDKLRSKWFNPNWLDLEKLLSSSTEPSGACPVEPENSQPPAPAPPPKLSHTPSSKALSLNPRSTKSTSKSHPPWPLKPIKLSKGSLAKVMRAIWAHPSVKSQIKSLEKDARQQWLTLKPGQKAMVITQSLILSGSVIAGIVAYDPSRLWVLEKINGASIPIPGTKGLSFRLYSKDGVVKSGGFGVKTKVVDFQYEVAPVELPNDITFYHQALMFKLNLHELIPALK